MQYELRISNRGVSFERLSSVWRAPWWLVIGLILGVVIGLLIHKVLPSRSALEEGELVILSGRDDSANGQRQALINQWNDLHPDNQARIVDLPGQADAQHSEMMAQAQAGRSDVDIYNLDVTWTAEFAHRGLIRPLDPDEVDTAGFLARPLETCRYDGNLWALPFNSDAGLLYYRSDLVPTPPRSWTRLKLETDQILERPQPPGSPLIAGYTGQLDNYEGLTVNALEAIWSTDGDVVSPSGDVVLADKLQETELGLDRLRQSATDPQFVLPDSYAYDETRSTQAFREGKVMFMRNWPVAYRSLAAPANEASPAPPVPFGVAALPGPSVLGGQNLAIAKQSSKPRAAQALIEFLTDARSQQLLFERGGFAATREIVYRDSAVTDQYKYARVLLEAIERSRLRPATPYYNRFSEVFRNVVHEALRDRKPLPADLPDRLREALKGK